MSDNKREIYVCPLCCGKKQIDYQKHGLYSPGDPSFFGPCFLCNEAGYILVDNKTDLLEIGKNNIIGKEYTE